MRRLPVPGPKLRLALMILACFSLFQYLAQGEISWHSGTLNAVSSTLRDYVTRPEAGWRRAAGKLEQVGAAREGAPPEFDITGRVVRVADGDSLSLLDRNNKQHTIRLYGIDAPERDQPHGRAASAALAALVANQRIGVAVIEEDDYGRLVGTAYVDNNNINLAMVRAGHAWWYRHYASREHALAAAEQEARQTRRGLWSGDAPVPPWDWRRQQRLQNNRGSTPT